MPALTQATDIHILLIWSLIYQVCIPSDQLLYNLPSLDVDEMVLDHCVSTTLAPHEEDYEISFDCSLLENETSNANKCSRGLPCTCICECIRCVLKNSYQFLRALGLSLSLFLHRDRVTGSKDFQFCNLYDEYDAFEKHHHPLYKVVITWKLFIAYVSIVLVTDAE